MRSGGWWSSLESSGCWPWWGGRWAGSSVLWWAAKHPQMVGGAVAMATAARLSQQALAFDVVARNAILTDRGFECPDRSGKDRGPGPGRGLAIARMIGHITYLSPEGMSAKFDPDRLRPRDVPTEFEKKFSVGSYLGYQGDKFVERFDANSYVSLSMAMDLLDLGSTAQEISACLAPSRCRWLVVSFSSDWLFPPRQSRDIVGGLLAAGKSVSYCNIQSGCGHDAFLLPNEAELYGNMIAALLTNVSRADGGADVELRNSSDELTCPLCKKEETSIFHEQRLDYRRIVEWIEPGTSALDLGCGTGTLLSHLALAAARGSWAWNWESGRCWRACKAVWT